MNIIPIEITFNTLNILYENRHLYTDDVEYNSLLISNLINKNVILMDVHNYHTLNKQYFFDETLRFTYILSKDGVYRQQGVIFSYSLKFYHWEEITDRTTQTIDILTVVV